MEHRDTKLLELALPALLEDFPAFLEVFTTFLELEVIMMLIHVSGD